MESGQITERILILRCSTVWFPGNHLRPCSSTRLTCGRVARLRFLPGLAGRRRWRLILWSRLLSARGLRAFRFRAEASLLQLLAHDVAGAIIRTYLTEQAVVGDGTVGYGIAAIP